MILSKVVTHIVLSHPTILVKTFGTLCVLGEENVIKVDPPHPPRTVLGVTSQTPFTYLVHFMDLNLFWGGGVGKKSCEGRVYECASQVSCKFHTKPSEKGEVSQNLLARIVVVTSFDHKLYLG